MAMSGALATGFLGVFFALCGTSEATGLFELRLEDLIRQPIDLLGGLGRTRRLSGGTEVTPCDYPGVVALTFNGRVMCEGIYQAGSVTIPNDCADFIKFVASLGDIQVQGSDGTQSGTIASSTSVTVTNNNDGTSTVPLTVPLPTGSCASNEYVAYDSSMTIDLASCEIVSYGGLSTQGHTYDGTLLSAPLVDNPLQGCCSYVLPNLEYYAVLGTIDTASYGYYTCAKTGAGVCNGDTGAPIFCTDTKSGQKVVVGMVATGSCSSSGETFVAIDLTGGSLEGFSA